MAKQITTPTTPTPKQVEVKSNPQADEFVAKLSDQLKQKGFQVITGVGSFDESKVAANPNVVGIVSHTNSNIQGVELIGHVMSGRLLVEISDRVPSKPIGKFISQNFYGWDAVTKGLNKDDFEKGATMIIRGLLVPIQYTYFVVN